MCFFSISLLTPNILQHFLTNLENSVLSLSQMLGVNSDIEKKHITLVNELCYMKSGNIVNLPHGILARKEYENVVFSLNNDKIIQTKSIKCKLGENVVSNNLTILVEEVSSDDILFGKDVHYCDLDSIPHNSVFRTRMKGDMFRRIGSGNKSFSDYLTNIKIPRNKRDDLIVLASGSTILAFIGHDISDQIKITDGTTRFGKITLIKA